MNKKRTATETKIKDERTAELIELMAVPEVRQVILAKFDQAKLIFKNEIKEYYKQKYPNLIEFTRPSFSVAKRGQYSEESKSSPAPIQHRIERQYRSAFFDTTRYVGLSEEEQIDVFLRYFKNNSQFRREVLYEFFLKKMPYADIYENAVSL